MCLTVLLALACTATSRHLLTDGAASDAVLGMAVEHQRILAELEEVHQLRERMLQEGMCLQGKCTMIPPSKCANKFIDAALYSQACMTANLIRQQTELKLHDVNNISKY